MKHLLLLTLFLSAYANSDYLSQLESSNRLHEQSLLSVLNNRDALKADLQSNDKGVASNALMKVIIAWELSDGANGIEIGEVLILAWKSNPILIGSWFDAKAKSKKRWFKSQDNLFNGLVETESYKEISKLRLDIIASLKDIPSTKSKACAEYLKVLSKLEVPNYDNS